MIILRRLFQSIFLLLILTMGTLSVWALPVGNGSGLLHSPFSHDLNIQVPELAFAARAPPSTGESIANTGDYFHRDRDAHILHDDLQQWASLNFGANLFAPNKGVDGLVIKTDAAGNSVFVFHGKEMSIHASKQATARGISNENISNAMKQKPFEYIQGGKTQKVYYDSSTNTFVGVGDKITTVIKPRNPENYIANLKSRQ